MRVKGRTHTYIYIHHTHTRTHTNKQTKENNKGVSKSELACRVSYIVMREPYDTLITQKDSREGHALTYMHTCIHKYV